MFKADSISYEIDYKELSLGKKLGQGGFGVVYQGTYRHSDVAVKQLLEQNISKEAASEFAAEAVVMAKLRHENIVQFLGYCVSPQYCIVMEYMPQGSLFSVLHSEQPLDWPERFRIAVDIAKGIAVLHCEHILHRDIKSLNVLLDAHRKAKLTDFGLSKVKTETQSKTKGGLVGTFAWMAPELSDEEGQYSSACDIYSLGITFWELATSKTPFAHIDGKRQMMIPIWAKQGKREPIPQDCPKPLADLIQACWATEPSTRPTAEQIVVRLKAVTGEFVPKTIEGVKSPSEIISPVPSEGSKSTKTTSGSNPPASGPVYPMNSTASSSSSLSSLNSSGMSDPANPESVLKKLKAFFMSDDYEGEEVKDLDLYNQALESHNASLVYSKKKQLHTLFVNDEPLEPKAAIKALSGMIASLKASSGSALQPSQPLPKSPSSQSISSGSLPSSPPEKSNVLILTPPPKKIEIAPALPKVNPQELGTFLRLVAEGEQGKAEAMLKQNRDLNLVPGDVTDLSKRTFRNITAFQYALWALDWHMWTMLLKYLPPEQAAAQAQQAETGSWVKEHGIHANWQSLIDAQKKYLDYCSQNKWSEAGTTWVKQVGGAQLLLPSHVISEYCHPSRSFSPCPDFTKPESNDAWRIRTTDEGEWFTAQYNGGGLGSGFGVCRGGAGNAWRGRVDDPKRAKADHQAVVTLYSARQKQRDELLRDLSRAHVPQRAAMS